MKNKSINLQHIIILTFIILLTSFSFIFAQSEITSEQEAELNGKGVAISGNGLTIGGRTFKPISSSSGSLQSPESSIFIASGVSVVTDQKINIKAPFSPVHLIFKDGDYTSKKPYFQIYGPPNSNKKTININGNKINIIHDSSEPSNFELDSNGELVRAGFQVAESN